VLPGEFLDVDIVLLEPISELLNGKLLELLLACAIVDGLGLLGFDFEFIEPLLKLGELLVNRGNHL